MMIIIITIIYVLKLNKSKHKSILLLSIRKPSFHFSKPAYTVEIHKKRYLSQQKRKKY